MNQPTVNNASFKTTVQIGASVPKQLAWYWMNLVFFKSAWLPGSTFKVLLLRIFGARVGRGVVVKPCVNIKYPWKLSIGDHTWIGENVWIDNLASVTIGTNVCISQGAYLLTGNHNYKRSSFDLVTAPIVIEDGAWIGAQSIVCPGITCRTHAVLSVGSVASTSLEPYTIYRGNPAIATGKRVID